MNPWRSNDPPEVPELLRPKPGDGESRPRTGDWKDESPYGPLMRVSTIGTEFAAAVAGMALVGWLLDRWWGTAPWALLICALVGLSVAMLRFIRDARALTSGGGKGGKAGERRKRGNGPPPP